MTHFTFIYLSYVTGFSVIILLFTKEIIRKRRLKAALDTTEARNA